MRINFTRIVGILLIFCLALSCIKRKGTVKDSDGGNLTKGVTQKKEPEKTDNNTKTNRDIGLNNEFQNISNLYIISQNRLGLTDNSEISAEAVIGGVAAIIALGAAAGYLMKKNLSDTPRVEISETNSSVFKSEIQTSGLKARELVTPRFNVSSPLTELKIPKEDLNLGNV